jgi:hypothetical protein
MRQRPGRFGSSRKKEAAGAARGMPLAMGFEWRFFPKSRVENGIRMEEREQHDRGRHGNQMSEVSA